MRPTQALAPMLVGYSSFLAFVNPQPPFRAILLGGNGRYYGTSPLADPIAANAIAQQRAKCDEAA
jgi:hypothetical protein